MKRESQKQKVLRYLRKDFNGITSWEAIMIFNITRLASVIHLLRNDGYEIETTEEGKEGKKWARYRLKE